MNVKLNTTGRFRVRFWDQEMQEMDEGVPDLIEKHIVPIVKLRGIWQQPGTKMWGASWDLTHAMCQKRAFLCPFADSETSAQ